MSVLVKGMEKPEHCGYCRFRYDGICHALQKTQYSMNECPLVVIDDAERKKGRWIRHEVKTFDGCHTGRFFDECSECGKLTPEWRKITEYHGWNYCPSCGADMRGEQDG